MAFATIRNASKTGLVLLESSIEVAEDGFVSIPAKFLAPASGLQSGDFDLDSVWPLSSFPSGLPTLQGGPYLASRTIRKQNSLTYIDAVYVSALNPVRVSISESDGKASFSGWAPPVQEGFTWVDLGAILVFDYTAVAVTHSYAIIGNNSYSPPQPEGRIGEKFNVVSSGDISRIPQIKQDIITRNVERVGRVQRISVTATPTYQIPYNRLLISAASAYGS